jgi:hypothetical protein
VPQSVYNYDSSREENLHANYRFSVKNKCFYKSIGQLKVIEDDDEELPF